jgi:hypothetical protein
VGVAGGAAVSESIGDLREAVFRIVDDEEFLRRSWKYFAGQGC